MSLKSPVRALLLAALTIQLSTTATASDWSRFRGPNGLGVSDTTGLPVEFGPDTNVVWKTNVPAGKSSPALTEDRILLTGHEDEKLLTFCLDRATGRILWRREAPNRRLEKMNRLNSEASSSPVTDGENVYAFFGGYGLVSYGPDGNQRWTQPLGPFTNFHGMGASPVLADGKILMVVDQDIDAYVIAFNKDDGSIAWKRERPEMVHSFSTPLVYRPSGGPAELIVPGSYQMVSYSIPDGTELWRVRGLAYQVKSVPVLAGDTLYFNGWAPGGMPAVRLVLPPFQTAIADYDKDQDGQLSKTEIPPAWIPGSWDMQDLDKDGSFNKREWFYYSSRRTSSNSTMAVRLGGRGDVTATHVLWKYHKSLPDVPSLLLYEGVLFGVKKGGIVTALDPKTGEVLRQGRLSDAVDDYYSSPVGADGKVYMASQTGKVSVLEATGDWPVLATNELGEDIYATPAIADGRIYLRTMGTLYCFGRAR
jgi:outer membrane protein assembly factor BamB